MSVRPTPLHRSFVPLLLLLLIAGSTPAQRLTQRDFTQEDTVYLVDGKTRTGRVVAESADTLVLRKGTKDTEIPQAEIEEVDAVWRSLPDLLRRIDLLGPLDKAAPADLLELARFAEQARLPGEAELLRFAALLQAPDDDAVFETLDLRTRQRGSQFRHGDSWRKRDELAEAPGAWADRWRLNTTHYLVESDQPLADAIAAAFDAERYFQDFYALLAEPAGFLETDEPMELRLYLDPAAFPEPGDGRRGFFDEQDFTVYVDVRGRGWSERLVHELTRQLVFETTLNSERARGELPRWLQEGLAMAFANGRVGPPGYAAHDPSALHVEAIREHVGARDEAYELRELLVFAYIDYAAHQRQFLKYAQSYTLFHALMYGADEAHREGLLRFVGMAYAGQGSPSHFEDALGLEREEIEAIWAEHLAQLARQV